MLNNPLVSVIMPAFNHEKFIADAINSVLNQTYQNIELLILDDCSEDSTYEVASRFQDSRISLFRHEKNCGICDTLNELMSKCNGSFIACLGSDDVWLPSKLECQVNYMRDNSNCAVCFTWIDVIDENNFIFSDTEDGKDFMSIFNVENKDNWIKYFFQNQNCLNAPSSLLRKSIADKVGLYDVKLRQLQDWDYWLRVLYYGEIHILKDKLVKYRWNKSEKSNLSFSTRENQLRHINEMLYVKYKFIRDMPSKVFSACFSDELVYGKDSLCNIECEKFLLLLKNKNYLNSMLPPIIYLLEILKDNNTRKVLDNNYNFSINDFYELTCNAIKICPIDMYEEYQKLSKDLIESLNNANFWMDVANSRFDIIRDMQNSISWKVTKPIRWIARILKKL